MKLMKSHRPAMMDVFSPSFVNRFFQEAFPNMGEEATTESFHFRPGADIVRTEAGYEVTLALPGISRADVKIELEGNTLTVSGERKKEEHSEQARVLRSEISYGRFVRSFTLNNEIRQDGIEASFNNGMLKITLPLVEKAQPRSIEIR